MLSSIYSTKSINLHNNNRSHVHHLLQICILQNEYEQYCSDNPAQFGGLQQYVNKFTASTSSLTTESRFHSLPDHVLEEIFLHLNPTELNSVRRVCKLWKQIVDDNLFWRRKLQKDLHLWCSIGHDCDPTLFNSHSDNKQLSAKQMYRLCNPKIPQHRLIYTPSFVPTLKNIFALMLNIQRKPRLAMLGPGLDYDAYEFSKKLIMDETLLTKVGMFPGMLDGLGSGFTFRLYTSTGLEYFDLVTLYSSNRTTQHLESRLHTNNLFSRSANGAIELSGPARAFCLSLDGLVYVVDSNCSIESLNEARQELYALTQQFWAKPRVPILVLSLASQTRTVPRKYSCYDIVRLMHLNELNGIWRIYNVDVDDLCGVSDAFTWIIQQCKSNS